jgi:two-component system cell cycle sensor histidine kinase/response regulator CckA
MTEKPKIGSSTLVGDNLNSAQQNLREREHLLRVLADHSPGHIAYVGADDLCYHFVNQKFESSFGRPREEIIGQHIKNIIGESNYEFALKYIEAVRAGKSTSYENVFNLEQGRRWIKVNYEPDLDERGNVKGIVVLSYDITELKQAEENLQKNERLYRSLFENTGTATFVAEEDFTISQVNAKCEELSGYSKEEIVGRMKTTDFVAPADLEQVINYHHARRNQIDEAPSEYEFNIKNRQGDVKTVFIQTGMIPETNQSIASIIDITLRKKAEEALQESQEKYRLLFENASDAIFIAQDGVIKFPNPGLLDLVGYSAEELAIMPFTDLIHPADRKMVLERYQKRIAGAQDTPATYSFRVIDKTGDELLVELSSVRIMWEKRPAALNFVRDTTQQKKVESQLQQAQRMESIGTLAGGIAHDFNNLLMGIQGNVSLIMADMDGSHLHYDRLDHIEQYVKSGSELTRQLLGFARGGKYEVRPSDLNPIINTSIDIFGRTKKEIRIHKKYQKEIWAVDIDQGQIEQVLLNLYVNAWQAMPAGGDLFLQTENAILDANYVKPYDVESGKFVKISIMDTGIGMDAATQKQIFDPFFTTKKKDRSTGLGLASAYGIINNHDGIIGVYSEPGEGTTFNIYLPATEKIVSKQQRNFKELMRGSEVLLLVDDEEFILEIGEDMLKRLGYKVVVAESGQKALDIYEKDQHAIDMVILDIIMPDMSGSETYDRLKEINPAIKTLLSSGYSINGKAQAILNSGCQGFIQKPFNLTNLSQKIRKILDAE